MKRKGEGSEQGPHEEPKKEISPQEQELLNVIEQLRQDEDDIRINGDHDLSGEIQSCIRACQVEIESLKNFPRARNEVLVNRIKGVLKQIEADKKSRKQ